MVSFYDYAFLKMKHSPLLLVLLLTFGCHNKQLHTLKWISYTSSSKWYKILYFLNEINDAYHFIVS